VPEKDACDPARDGKLDRLGRVLDKYNVAQVGLCSVEAIDQSFCQLDDGLLVHVHKLALKVSSACFLFLA